MANDAKFVDSSTKWYMVPCFGKRRNMVIEPSPPGQEHNSIDKLPDHLLMEVLCRLPSSKSAFLCKSVCKRWDALVSQPYFISHFINHKVMCGFIHIESAASCSNLNVNVNDIIAAEIGGCIPKRNELKWEEQQLVGVVMQHYACRPLEGLLMHWRHPISNLKGLSFDSLPCFREGNSPVNVIGAFNDLLLCLKESLDGHKHEFSLCNVQTRQWHVLPSPPNLLYKANNFGFLCEPYYYFKKEGNNNGTTIVSDSLYRYSIVTLPHDKYGMRKAFTEFNVHIFSSESSRWRESVLLLPSPSRLDIPSTCGFGFNGKIHIRSLDHIIGFDPFNNGSDGNGGAIWCHLIKWPTIVAISHATVAVWQGRLQVSRIDDHGRLDIWVLVDYNMGLWSLQHSATMRDFIPHAPSSLAKNLTLSKDIWVMGFHPSCPHVLILFCAGLVVLCDVPRRSLETVCRIPSGFSKLFFRWDTVFWVTLPLWPTPLRTYIEYNNNSSV